MRPTYQVRCMPPTEGSRVHAETHRTWTATNSAQQGRGSTMLYVSPIPSRLYIGVRPATCRDQVDTVDMFNSMATLHVSISLYEVGLSVVSVAQ